MSSKLLSAVMSAGLSVALLQAPSLAMAGEREPASSRTDNCSDIRTRLNDSTTSATCEIVTQEKYGSATREYRTTIQVEKVVKEVDGKKEVLGYRAQADTEGGCDECGVKTNGSTTFQDFDKNASLTDVINFMREKTPEKEKDLNKAINEKLTEKRKIERCLIDESGEKLNDEEQLTCKMDKLESMDDEKEADKYFKGQLKDKLEEMLNSDNESERKKALEMLGSLKSVDFSSDVKAEIKQTLAVEKGKSQVQEELAQIRGILQNASMIQNPQARQQYLNLAKSRYQRMENAINQIQQQEVMKATQSGKVADLSVTNAMRETLTQAMSTDSALMALMGTPNAHNSARVVRGGTGIPDNQLLIQIPQVGAPTNTTFPTAPNAVNGATPNPTGGRGAVSGSRVPVGGAAVINQNPGIPVNGVQPYPQQVIGGQVVGQPMGVYNPVRPMGPQFMNGIPAVRMQ
ncbi:MAG TPA: hypothetical protein DCL41_04910 [Bdellovibrionales bacterium]|nr:hypothetical protein [Pseudobdellovibrionaceae bacterium]HAG91186.1 hypothetical protein [Bdellovibrionales bacterium]